MKLPLVPASFFAMVLGLVGLGNAWRVAARLWHLPSVVGEAVIVAGLVVWAALVILYVAKWIVAPALAAAEVADPVQCCFVGLAGVATMIAGIAVLPYGQMAGAALLIAGVVFTYGFGLWRTGHIWRGGRNHAATTPVLYLPLVAGSFVCAVGLSLFGLADWGQLVFGAGFFSWLAIESVLLHRLYTAEPLAEALRPTLGIQLAPPAVGALAYALAADSSGDVIVHAMIGYALLQFVILVGMVRWIVARFTPSLWSFSFGATALATVTETLAARGDIGAVATLAPLAFVLANGLVAALFAGTLYLLATGRLVPPRPTLPTSAPRPA